MLTSVASIITYVRDSQTKKIRSEPQIRIKHWVLKCECGLSFSARLVKTSSNGSNISLGQDSTNNDFMSFEIAQEEENIHIPEEKSLVR